jgi:glycosyltransferase involved in cell wall biosynthesis
VTIHDLYFLTHPERSRAEVRRDYPALARDHAQRADQIIVPSRFTALAVQQQLDIPSERISVCPHGRPAWAPRSGAPSDGYVLFFGTLEPRKNVAGLLDAYQRLIEGIGPRRDRSSDRGHTGSCPAGGRGVPPLVLAGHAPDDARVWLERVDRPPLQGVVRHLGYVDPSRRRELYAGARLLVQPSFEEGFGLPVLEAMTMGVPVVAANRGALPEVLGGAGLLVDPENPDDIASAIDRVLNDETVAAACTSRGLVRAREFDWQNTARLVHAAYREAVEHRQCGSA